MPGKFACREACGDKQANVVSLDGLTTAPDLLM
jgi:hypothetical protein